MKAHGVVFELTVFHIAGKSGSRAVTGHACGPLAYHPVRHPIFGYREYRVTHIPTGYCITEFRRASQARAFIAEVGSLDWNFTDPNHVEPDSFFARRVMRIADRIHNQKAA